MNLSTLALFVTVTLGILSVVAALFVLAREGWKRVSARRELARLLEARTAIDAAKGEASEGAMRALQSRFDTFTLDRALEATVRGEPGRVAWVASAYRDLGLTQKAIRDVRQARAWSERARAAEVLGLLGVVEAVPALVEALRDPYEDTLSVKVVVAEALARIQDPAVIPLLAKELHTIDEWSSPRIAEALVRFGTAATPVLVDVLNEEDRSGASVWAARILGRIGDPVAVPSLIERMHDRQDVMRVAASEALGAIGDRRAAQPLIDAMLRDPIAQVRAHAAGAIGRLGDEGSADVLIAALGDPDFGTRIRALEAFEMIGPKNIAPMEMALRDPRIEVRRRAAQAMERVGYLDERIAELGSDDPELSAKAYATVLELGRAGLADSLAGHLSHTQFQVRARIAQACGELGATRVGPLLLSSVDDPSWPVRVRLAEAIGRLRVEGGATVLVKLLSDPELPVREHAAQALTRYPAAVTEPLHDTVRAAFERGSLAMRVALLEVIARDGREDSLDLLVEASREAALEVRLRAVAGLARQPSHKATEVLERALTDAAVEVRMAAVDVLGTREGDEPLETLLRSLSGAIPEVRERIAKALASGGRTGAALQERLAGLADSDDRDVRLGVAWTLGKIGSPAGVPTLSALLHDQDPGLRASAAGALGKIRAPEALSALVEAILDRDARTRAALVNAIGRQGLGTPLAVGALEGRLVDPDAFVRNRALLALARLCGPAAEASLVSRFDDARFDGSARIIAMSLVGTDACISRALAAIATPSTLRAVRAKLAEEDEEVRRLFLSRLNLEDHQPGSERSLEVEDIISQYHKLLHGSQDVRARRLAVEALAAFESENSLDTLGDALATDPSEEVRLKAAQVVAARSDQEPARQVLLRAVRDPSEAVAKVVLRSLGRTKDGRFSDALFQRLGDSTAAVELEAIEALAEIHRGAVDPFIDRMMGSDRPEVVVACLKVLERIGSPTVLPLLRQLVRSRSAAIRAAVIRALSVLPGRGALEVVDNATRDPHEVVRLAAMDAVALRDPPTAFERLEGMRTDPSAEVRRRLAVLLGAAVGGVTVKPTMTPAQGISVFTRLIEQESPGAERILDALLHDLSPVVRAAAMATLIEWDTSRSLRRFRDEWGSASPEVQRYVRSEPRAQTLAERAAVRLEFDGSNVVRELSVMVIAAFAASGWEEQLLAATREPALPVRIAAIGHLARARRPDVRAALEEIARDGDGTVSSAARAALERAVETREDAAESA